MILYCAYILPIFRLYSAYILPIFCLYSAYILPIFCLYAFAVAIARISHLRAERSLHHKITEAPSGRTVSLNHTTRRRSNLQRIMSTRALHHLLYVFYDLLVHHFVLRGLTMQAPYFSKLLVRAGSTKPASTPSTHRPIVPSSLRSPAASRPE
jgi:hypothetical protein